MNEPAFPRHGYETPTDGWKSGQEGMSLRDYFAAKAMAALMVSPNLYLNGERSSGPIGNDEIAIAAYQYADEMLKARGE